MTTETTRIQAIVQDARDLQADARPGQDPQRRGEGLGSDEARHDALVLGRNRRGTGADSGDGRWAKDLAFQDPVVRDARMVARYYTRQGRLHGGRCYNGLCDPLEDTERRIRETADYIDDAQRVKGGFKVDRAGGSTHWFVPVEKSAAIHGLRAEARRRWYDKTPEHIPGKALGVGRHPILI